MALGREPGRGLGGVGMRLAVAVALAALASAAGAAEQGWVRGAPLNLRSGAGTQYRILGLLKPGEAVRILERSERWTRVRAAEGREGWISAGYLDSVPPPVERLAHLEAQLARTRAELEDATGEASEQRTAREALEQADSGQREELDRLTRENMRMRAGERWAEWLTGGLLLSLGMAAGAILSRLGGRRQARRLRL